MPSVPYLSATHLPFSLIGGVDITSDDDIHLVQFRQGGGEVVH